MLGLLWVSTVYLCDNAGTDYSVHISVYNKVLYLRQKTAKMNEYDMPYHFACCSYIHIKPFSGNSTPLIYVITHMYDE
jgi:hypothetical protein